MAGRGSVANSFIVPAEEILTQEQIREEEVTYKTIFELDGLNLIIWLARRLLLKNRSLCERCYIFMNFVKKTELCDGYRWQCRQCRKSASIRTASFFSRSHLSLDQIVLIIYGWCRDMTQRNISHEARLGEHSTHTIVDWCNFCRDICETALINKPHQIGGLNDDMTSKVVDLTSQNFSSENTIVVNGVQQDTGFLEVLSAVREDVSLLRCPTEPLKP